MPREQLISGGGLQTSASFSSRSCLSSELGGLQTSASYRVEVGCAAVGADPVPVGLIRFVVE